MTILSAHNDGYYYAPFDTLPEIISQVMSILAGRDGYYGFNKFPTPEHTITVLGSEGDLLVVWFGPNWLGGRELRPTVTEKRLRDLDPGDRSLLLHLLSRDTANQRVPPNYG